MTTEANTIPAIALIHRILGIIFSPLATFTAVKQSIGKGDYIIPLVLILAVAIGSRGVVLPLAYDRGVTAILQNSEISEDLREIQLEGLDNWFEKSNKPVGQIIALAATLVWVAIQAGVLLFMASIVLGGSGTFWSALVVACYAQLINVLAALIKIPMMLYTQNLNVETGFALLLPRSIDSSLLYRFFHRLDLFTIWVIWVMGIGVAAMFDIEQRRINRLLYGSWVVLMFVLAWLVDGRMPA